MPGFLLLGAALAAAADLPLAPGRLAADPPTFNCLAVRWDVAGDPAELARGRVEYRRAGATAWERGPDLFRTSATQFAGSILGLDEGAAYDVRCTLADPATAGDASTTLRLATRRPLAPWAGGRTLHVRPGDGGGSGSAADPFRGLAAADAAARPGDTILLETGVYAGPWEVRTDGAPGRPVTWKAAGDAVVDGGAPRPERAIAASDRHDLILEGLDVRNARWLLVLNRAQRVAVRRCRFTGGDFGIVACERTAARPVEDLEISDCTLVGPCTWPRTKGIEDPRGIQVAGTGTVIRYNRISGFGDGVDTFHVQPVVAVDIHGNDISECTDDGIELDFSDRNVRCWGNRITNTWMGISLQPVYGGPVYVLRNALYNIGLSAFKLHDSPSGAVLVHNTCVRNGIPFELATADPVWRCVLRDNLFVGTTGAYAFESSAPMRACDADHDGFAGGPWTSFMKWNAVRYRTPADAAGAAEAHAVLLPAAGLFASGIEAPADPDYAYPAPDLRLAPGAGAADRGEPLPGLDDGFHGAAPDLGAYEVGDPLPGYGPR